MMGTKALVAVMAAASMAVCAMPSPALAAVRAGSETFNPNSSAPTFNPPPQLPLVTLTVSYDDAGTITIGESGVVQDNGDTAGDAFFPDIYLAGAGTPNIYTTPDYGEHLEDDRVVGSLDPQTTTSPDGSTVTYVWSSPYLANLNLTFVRVVPNSFSPSFTGSFYFPGYTPFVTIANPGAQTGRVGTPATLQIDARELGISQDDQNGSGITRYSATSLPPGLSINTIGQIHGKPTKAGTFTPTITATGGYNTTPTADGTWAATQNTSASTTFRWVIKPAPPPVMPTSVDGGPAQTRPHIIVLGNGALLGGWLRKAGHHRDWRKNFGKLRWTVWSATDGWATGAWWLNDCRPACVVGTFLPTRASVHVYRPNSSFVFTRMTIDAGRYRVTAKAYRRNGVWYWG